jgi:hypothetical protein
VAKTFQIDGTRLNTGLAVMQGISEFQPYSSISFLATDQILGAVVEVGKLVDWGMAKNMQKMKSAALEIIEIITESMAGDPVNLNLDDYQLKSISAVVDLIERTLDEGKDGVNITNLPQE